MHRTFCAADLHFHRLLLLVQGLWLPLLQQQLLLCLLPGCRRKEVLADKAMGAERRQPPPGHPVCHKQCCLKHLG